MNTTPSSSAIAGQHTAEADVSSLITDGRSPLPSEILLNLGAIYATNEMKGLLGELDEIREARGVQAGLASDDTADPE